MEMKKILFNFKISLHFLYKRAIVHLFGETMETILTEKKESGLYGNTRMGEAQHT